MKDKEIERIVRGFTKGLLDKDSNENMCFAVCSPLSTYLRMCGISNLLMECTLEKGEDRYHHWIILLPDGRIIDPTASQFNKWVSKPLPDIYIGEKPGYYNLVMPQNIQDNEKEG
jgi:hypothetical protein